MQIWEQEFWEAYRIPSPMEMENPSGHQYQVGDILFSSWGYGQTNINFYQVVGVTNKGIKIRKIKSRAESHGPGVDFVVPVDGSFDGKVMTKLVRPHERGSVKIDSHEYAYAWDGKSKMQTAFGYGH